MTMTMNKPESKTPLADALAAARADLAAAEETLANHCAGPELSGEAFDRVDDELEARVRAAEQAVDAALDALSRSDEGREWAMAEEGFEYASTTAATAGEALDEALGRVDRSNYNGVQGTIWIDVSVRCILTGEEASDTAELHEDEPECADGEEHDWQSPLEIVGGCANNPGVWGHGGGVIIRKVCLTCGCGRTTDTWAQRPDTGEQGLTSVSYEPGQYADEISAMGREP